jgi:hypothetical protein
MISMRLLYFPGGNPENIDDLGAEISICLGDELEEHNIKSAAVYPFRRE